MENGKKSNGACCSKLSVCNLGMAIGVVTGLGAFVCGLLSMFFGFGVAVVDVSSTLYYGYEATLLGSLFGLFWGFVHGFIVGALIAFIYNFCHCKCPCSSCKENRSCCN